MLTLRTSSLQIAFHRSTTLRLPRHRAEKAWSNLACSCYRPVGNPSERRLAQAPSLPRAWSDPSQLSTSCMPRGQTSGQSDPSSALCSSREREEHHMSDGGRAVPRAPHAGWLIRHTNDGAFCSCWWSDMPATGPAVTVTGRLFTSYAGYGQSRQVLHKGGGASTCT